MPKGFARRKVNFTFQVKGFLAANKWFLIALCVLGMLGLLTGVLVAVKSGVTLENIECFNLSISSCSGKVEFSGVWEKFWSVFINLSIISISSLYVLLLPVGFAVIGYRAYLVGFNSALLFCLFGVGGAITSVIAILPCQLLILMLEIIFFSLVLEIMDSKKRFGRSDKNFLKVFLVATFIGLIICIIEAVLISVFSASTILKI